MKKLYQSIYVLLIMSGFLATATLTFAQVTTSWTFPLGGYAPAVSSVDGTIYVSSPKQIGDNVGDDD
jgi:hypothetical protein